MVAPKRARLTSKQMHKAVDASNWGKSTAAPGAWEAIDEASANKAWGAARKEAKKAATELAEAGYVVSKEFVIGLPLQPRAIEQLNNALANWRKWATNKSSPEKIY